MTVSNLFIDNLSQEQIDNSRALISALRSGKYQQGRNTLKEMIEGSYRFCCLGVACELAVSRGKVLGIWQVAGPDDNGYPPSYQTFEDNQGYSSSVELTEEVREIYGFRTCQGSLTKQCKIDDKSYTEKDLAGLNDTGMSFNQIADTIEQELNTNLQNRGQNN